MRGLREGGIQVSYELWNIHRMALPSTVRETYCCWSEEERLEISREASGRTYNGWMDGSLEGALYYMHSIIIYNVSH